MINAGKYRHPIQFLTFGATRHPVTKAPVQAAPAVVGSAFARATVLTGNQAEKARQLFEGATVQFEVRANPSLAITPKMGIRHAGKDYEIGAVVPVEDEREAELRILAREKP
jgi:SPP1 family predicted phage head-tail adaptor